MMQTLTQMVREANASGRSFDALAAAAIDPVTQRRASKAWLVKLARGGVTRMPDLDLLRAVAAMLRKPVMVIQQAAAHEWLDYQGHDLPTADPDTRIIVAHLGTMTAADRRRIRRLVESWTENQESDNT